MRRVLGAAFATVWVCGCVAPPPTTPGTGSGAAYAPMVEMEGVAPDAYATDVEACRAAALKVRVIGPTASSETADALLLAVGIVVPFGMVGIAAISGIAAALNDDMNPAGRPADPPLQQTVLVNCMARKGYKNLDPRVTVTYVAAAKGASPRKTGVNTYVAEQFAKASQCSAKPSAVLEDKGPGFERYSVECASGQPLTLHCEFGNCRQHVASGN
ncbi:MAG: hypothetical protein EOP82_30710 [Variovorax sp.]|nr:MAG: hypothetical protein EOP82_30710 [Variovorax sp.]